MKLTREKAIDKLVEHEVALSLGGDVESDLYFIFRHGCSGVENLEDRELEGLYQDYFDKKLVIAK